MTTSRLFCATCGAALELREVEGRTRDVCSACGQIFYVNPLPTAGAIVCNAAREVLLVKRAKEPFKGMWCLPIGFAEVGETITQAALRELREEAGLEGRVRRLVDAASHDNPLYGDLLIVTFEVEHTGGVATAGDDAEEVRWFPVNNLPRLAFDAQNAAMERFLDLHADEWRILDSMQKLVEAEERPPESLLLSPPASDLLSDELLRVVEADSEAITDLWLEDVTSNPATPSYHSLDQQLLALRASLVLGSFSGWLRRERAEGELKRFFALLGGKREEEQVPLPEVVAALILLKKHLWGHVVSQRAWLCAIDVVRVLEMDRRIAAFFDRAVFHVVSGYVAR
jgi:ADP-ribose pyrophosphatase YjhB (NUDIX family)